MRKDIIIIVRKIPLKDPSVPTLPADAGVEMKESFEGGLGKQIRTVSGPLREKAFKRITALKASASAALSNHLAWGQRALYFSSVFMPRRGTITLHAEMIFC